MEADEKEMVEYLEFFKMVYALWGTDRWNKICGEPEPPLLEVVISR